MESAVLKSRVERLEKLARAWRREPGSFPAAQRARDGWSAQSRPCAVPGKASERTVKLPFVAFDNAPLAAREVNAQSHDVPLSLVAVVDGAESHHEVTPSQTWYAHPGF